MRPGARRLVEEVHRQDPPVLKVSLTYDTKPLVSAQSCQGDTEWLVACSSRDERAPLESRVFGFGAKCTCTLYLIPQKYTETKVLCVPKHPKRQLAVEPHSEASAGWRGGPWTPWGRARAP